MKLLQELLELTEMYSSHTSMASDQKYRINRDGQTFEIVNIKTGQVVRSGLKTRELADDELDKILAATSKPLPAHQAPKWVPNRAKAFAAKH